MSLKDLFSSPRSRKNRSAQARSSGQVDTDHEPPNPILGLASFALGAVKDASDAFPPLKSVAGGLSYLLTHYEQWLGNRSDVERLIKQVERLQNKLVKRKVGLDQPEIDRRSELTRRIKLVEKRLREIQATDGFMKYVQAGQEAQVLRDMVEEIRESIMEYQLAVQMNLYEQNLKEMTADEIRDIQCLYRSQNASYQSDHGRTCLGGTRTHVLHQLESWSSQPQDKRVYWLNGHAGSGKTTIARSFCERLFADNRLGASFFCSRDFLDRSELLNIFPTIAYQLCVQFPVFRKRVVATLRARSHSVLESLASQLKELLIEPLKETKISAVIAIDALDECKDDEPASAILSLLGRYIHQIPLVKFFITGRPEAPIRKGFRLPLMKPVTNVFILHDVEQTQVDHDIALYFRTRLPELVKDWSDLELPSPWPSEDDIRILTEKAAGLFIFAATAVALITSIGHEPVKQLALVTASPGSNVHEGQWGIDELYSKILEGGYGALPSNSDPTYFAELRQVWGCIVAAVNPLTKEALVQLLGCNSNKIAASLRLMHSVMQVPETRGAFIRVYHKSFPDFLTDPGRCTSPKFFINPNWIHAEMAIRCLQLMNRSLRKNICGIHAYSMNNTLDLDTRKQTLGYALEYACRFWTRHLSQINTTSHSKDLEPGLLDQIDALIEEFLKNKQLFWFEAMSLVEDLGRAVFSLKELQAWLHQTSKKELIDWAIDGQNLLLKYYDPIQVSALHIYHSALPFSPLNSLLRHNHPELLLGEVQVLNGLDHNWETTFRMIQTQSSQIFAMLFSQDGAMLISAGNCGIQIFHAATGSCLATLVVPDAWPLAIAISSDSVYLVSSWSDRLIHLWDIQTGDLIRTCTWHQTGIINVAFSPDDLRFSSLDRNAHICIWSTLSGKLEYRVKAMKGALSCLWSPQPQTLVVYSPSLVQEMNIVYQSAGKSFSEHKSSLSMLVPSPDEPLLVWLKKDVLKVLGLSSQKAIHSFNCDETSSHIIPNLGPQFTQIGHPQVSNLMVSPDSTAIILRKQNQLIIYDTTLYQPLDSSQPSPASSFHKSTGSLKQIAHGTVSVFSPDGVYLALGSSQDGTISFSHWRASVQAKNLEPITVVETSLDGRVFMSGSQDGKIGVWSMLPSQTLALKSHPREGLHGRAVEAVAISPDNQHIAAQFAKSRSSAQTLLLWPTFDLYPQPQTLKEQRDTKLYPLIGDGPSPLLLFVTSDILLRVQFIHNKAIVCEFWEMTGKVFTTLHSYIMTTAIDPPWRASVDENKVLIDHQASFKGTYSCLQQLPRSRFQISSSIPIEVNGNNWIANDLEKDVLWVPYTIASATGSWNERGQWWARGGTVKLILGGKNGKTYILDFSLNNAANFIKTKSHFTGKVTLVLGFYD